MVTQTDEKALPEILHLQNPTSSDLCSTTEFAKAEVCEPAPAVEPARTEKQTPPMTYGPPQWAHPSFTEGFPGSAFTPQPDGTLRCPADRPPLVQVCYNGEQEKGDAMAKQGQHPCQ